MLPAQMTLKILLPFAVFAAKTGVLRVVAETSEGAFGLWPRRLDCTLALTPGIFTYESDVEGEVYVAIDDGVLVKSGLDLLVSVRRAVLGTNLEELRNSVEQDFAASDEREQSVRSVTAKLEAGFLNRLVSFHHE